MLRNALNNLAGALFPALVMLITVPLIVRGLGAAEYGLFVVLTTVSGYMAVLDINVSSGAIKFIAESRAVGDYRRMGEVLGFSAAFYLFIGVLGATLIHFFAPQLVKLLAEEAVANQAEAVQAMQLTAVAFLLGQLYTCAIGVPQALERYDLSSRIEVLNGLALPLLSALLVYWGGHLVSIMWLRIAMALLTVVLLVLTTARLLPDVRFRWPGQRVRGELMAFSSFAYLSRLASLSYQHADKLVVAGMLDIKQVAYYSLPVMLANRVLGMTYRLSQVIFPASSALLARGQAQEVRQLMLTSMRYVFAINAAAVLLIGLLGRWFLQRWIGGDFAEHGTTVLVLIAVGALIDSITNAPSMVTDGAGRPKVTGLFAISRAIVGLLGLFIGAKFAGIVGIAASHLVVSAAMTLAFMAYFARQVLQLQAWGWIRQSIVPGLIVAFAGALVGESARALLRAQTELAAPLACVLALPVMCAVAWHVVLLPTHRQQLAQRLQPGRRRA